MGIFELIILISAAIIFIILIRRFPDTADRTDRGAAPRRSFPSLSLPSFSDRFKSKPLAATSATDVAEPASITPVAPNQPEPGTDPDELARFNPSMRQLLSEAGTAYAKGDFMTAERLYLKAASEDPKCVIAYNRLGLLYLKNPKTLEDAEEAFRQAHKYEPDNGYVLDNLGLVMFTKGLFNEAVGFYERSITSDDKIAERHAHLGLAELSLRHYAKAVRHLARSWALEPSNLEFKELLDDAKQRERRQRTERH